MAPNHPTSLLVLLAAAACSAAAPDDLHDGAGGSMDTAEATASDESADAGAAPGDDTDGATSTIPGDYGDESSGGGASGDDAAGGQPDCVLEVGDHACLDLLALVADVCPAEDGTHARRDCAASLARILGAPYAASTWVLTLLTCDASGCMCFAEPGAPAEDRPCDPIWTQCEDLTIEAHCALDVDDTVQSCVDTVLCSVGPTPKTCVALDPATAEATCEALLD